jgi:hypothetical protein
MKLLHADISVRLNSLIMKIALDGRDPSHFLVEKILNKTDSKLRRKLNFTVQIWSTFALTKNQVYNTFRKNLSLRLT